MNKTAAGTQSVGRGSYDVSGVVFTFHERVVQPDELFMLSDHRELVLLEVWERALWEQQ